jgi:UDP-N-acetylglucosamine 2-epimerase (non-hydrolysing)
MTRTTRTTTDSLELVEILCVVGARPNFVKVAPVFHALNARPDVRARLLHTGQHYDHVLSDTFVEQLGLPTPAFHLGVGSGSHAEQTGAVMVGVERILKTETCDLILVPGDVNSTIAAALAAAKVGVPIAHLESGLRSRDWTMPEEINRVVTDRVSDLLLCHCDEAVENLAAEGITGDAVALVGNTLIDSLFRLQPAADATDALGRHAVERGRYVLVTLHRPALVDDDAALLAVLDVLARLAERRPVLFPVHPRTQARLTGLSRPEAAMLRLVDPLDYLEFIALEAGADLVITDSGGVQEETSALGVPCLTYRTTTERPVTMRLGTNQLVGLDPEALLTAATQVLDGGHAAPSEPIPLWDGHAGERAAHALVQHAMNLTGTRTPSRDRGRLDPTV